MNGKKKFYLMLGILQIVLVITVFFSINGLVTLVAAQTTSFDYFNSPTSFALAIGAAIAVSVSVVGSALALKTVGTAAIASLAEREETFFKSFLIVALAEALAVYGLIIAILLWTKIPNPI
jgi:F0F1-type ATP synthase membrane subunit c/vacuolar-type H+-ATPase subunit K